MVLSGLDSSGFQESDKWPAANTVMNFQASLNAGDCLTI